MPKTVKLQLIPPPPPVSLGEVQITMPVESAIAIAAALAYLPLGRIDAKLTGERYPLMDTFSVLYELLVSESGNERHNEVYNEAKEAVRTTVEIKRKDRANPDNASPR